MKTNLPPDKKRRKLDEGLSNKLTIGKYFQNYTEIVLCLY